MRTLPLISDTWNAGGPFIGDRKPVTRVTIQEPWGDVPLDIVLRTTYGDPVGSSADRGIPMRWYQRQDNSQIEKEIPSLLSISIDRTVDQDAAGFNFEMLNQWMYPTGAAPTQAVTGQPGYFTPDRGDSAEAAALWGHIPNEWHNLLIPNAIVRVYTGFGGERDPIPTAVANGNLALFGVFLIDDVNLSADGKIRVSGRDMAKLLIEQQLFPPLVPSSRYPLTYSRWSYEDVPVRTAAKTIPVNVTDPGLIDGTKAGIYRDSSQDRWYGPDASIHGHRGSHSVDGNPHTYALSVGNSSPHRDFSTVWWEYDCGEMMNGVHIHPWAGGYDCFISVMEGGQWVANPAPDMSWAGDKGLVPYSASHILATQSPAVDTQANIPYVAKFHVPHEQAGDYVLPRAYNAERVRISFRNLYDSGIGPWRYRGGIRVLKLLGIASLDTGGHGADTATGEAITYAPFLQAGASRIVKDKPWSLGYVTVSSFDQTDVFGDARRVRRNVYEGHTSRGTSIAMTPSGDGYWIMGSWGRVRSHGDAVWYGDPKSSDGFTAPEPEDPVGSGQGYLWDIAATYTGNGYYVVTTGGKVFTYGDAQWFGDVGLPEGVPAVSIATHPSAQGYWVLRGDGTVQAFGAATHFGGFGKTDEGALRVVNTGSIANENEGATCIRATSTGQGYWILTSKGRILCCGDAPNWGQPSQLADHSKNIFTESYWRIMPAPLDRGYWLLHGSGTVTAYGEMEEQNLGSPVPGTNARLRSDGDYTDYTDIARDLALWSGFLFFDPNHSPTEPAPLYGAVESTGAFAHDRLPDEMFDKRPVIDALTALREAVGYYCWVDEEGRFRWESPNFWKVGNFNENGEHVPIIPEINERVQLSAYNVSTSDDPLRSSIVISSHDPFADYSSTVTHFHVPPSAPRLRGLVKPAMWVNDFFSDKTEQQLMAELISLHISFQERIGQIDCVATPHIQIGDQVRVYERNTAEVYIHYVRGIAFNHDLNTGDYRMTLTTHWLAAGADSGDIIGGEAFPASALLQQRIDEGQYGKTVKDPGGRL